MAGEVNSSNSLAQKPLILESLQVCYQRQKTTWLRCERATPEPGDLPFPEPALPGVFAGSTVAPRKALSRWLCCFASCSRVSSSRIRWSLSYWRDFCHFLLWVWANMRKSLQACMEKELCSTQLVREFPQASVSLLSNHILGTFANYGGRLIFIPQYQGQPAPWCNQGQPQGKNWTWLSRFLYIFLVMRMKQMPSEQ